MTATPSAPRVLCSGILVADLFVPPLPALPAPGQGLCATEDFLVDTGGCAANVAVALARLGTPAAVAGRVGRDLFGDFILQDLAAKGVCAEGVRRSAGRGTSKTVILPVTGEDRRYIHTFGANAEFEAGDVDVEAIPAGGVLYLGGFLAMPGLEAQGVAGLFAGARERGVRTVLDVVVPAGRSVWLPPELQAVLPHVDYFLPNGDEAEALTGETEPLPQARCFREAGCRNAVITHGGEGALLLNESGALAVPAYPVDVVDGSGAGDALAAGLIVGLLEGWPDERLLCFAAAVGALACTRLGCSAGIRTRAATEEFIRNSARGAQARKHDDG